MKKLLIVSLLASSCHATPIAPGGTVAVAFSSSGIHGMHTLSAPDLVGVDHVTIKLFSQDGDVEKATHRLLPGQGTSVQFQNLPDGVYYATAEAFSSSDDSQSNTQGGAQRSTNEVTVASPNVTYSAPLSSGLNVALTLLDGQGGTASVNVTTDRTPTAYDAWLLDGAGNLRAPYGSSVPSFRFEKIPDGIFQAVVSLALDGTTTLPSRLSSQRLTYASGVGMDGADFALTIDGKAQAVTSGLNKPRGVWGTSQGVLYIADTANHCIRKYDNGALTIIAGNSGKSGHKDDKDATKGPVRLDTPSALVMAANGSLYIADTANHCIRMVSNGGISTVIGQATKPGFSGDGASAATAKLSSPRGLAFAANGDLYIADSGNNRIRMVSAATGNISTVAGDGTTGVLKAPEGISLAANGDLYIADTGNHRIRKLSGGSLTTVAGTGTSGWSGDGGPATAARLNSPKGVVVGIGGDVLIADSGNHWIRRLSGDTLTFVSGDGGRMAGSSGDGGNAEAAKWSDPIGLWSSPTGELYVADAGNGRIRVIR